MSDLAVTAAHLNTIATAIQTVETAATTAVAATGQSPTSTQKLQAAVTIAAALNPNIAALVTPVESLISSMVSVFNLFGLFKK
jgi:hypothetical protein